MKTDMQAAAFVEQADLADYDLSQMRPARFEFSRKEARINMRVPRQLLVALKAAALQAGIPYQRFIRQTLESALNTKIMKIAGSGRNHATARRVGSGPRAHRNG